MYRLKYFPRDLLPLRHAMEFRSTSIASKLCRSQQDRQSLAVHRQLLKKKEDKPCDVGRSHSDVFLWCSVRLLFRVQVDAHQWHSFWFLRWSDSSLPFLLLHRTVVRTFVCDTSASSAKKKDEDQPQFSTDYVNDKNESYTPVEHLAEIVRQVNWEEK